MNKKFKGESCGKAKGCKAKKTNVGQSKRKKKAKKQRYKSTPEPPHDKGNRSKRPLKQRTKNRKELEIH